VGRKRDVTKWKPRPISSGEAPEKKEDKQARSSTCLKVKTHKGKKNRELIQQEASARKVKGVLPHIKKNNRAGAVKDRHENPSHCHRELCNRRTWVIGTDPGGERRDFRKCKGPVAHHGEGDGLGTSIKLKEHRKDPRSA